ncbi:dTDP-glucose 4,6-dehydratase [Streptomyces durbertensis]|uniref:dTDP-glucose 4,6-dehydratase n=1 Tax=Streptomyces durbertensis TaxID=2448886 RepID=A0ABR6EA24_9ACTN|nr:dTDP-glucose 4,6-dehydratase [Streptomyces durbertensis]MBB1242199.1 dTDP-glucose 4,6-dehydratase [Streptomyces durbertensis]
MRILVTGGAGFIGSCYTRMALDDRLPGLTEARITVLDKLTYAGSTANLPMDHPRLRFVRGDVCDLPLLLETLPGHDAVVHFAAESHVDRSLTGPAEFVRTNVQGTQTLLEACLRTGTGPVVHVSTDEVYGSVPTGRSTEDAPLAPNSVYAASKAGSDLVARAYWRTHGLDVRVTRCSNNYGPYQHVEKLIPLFSTRLLEGRPVPLYGTGENVRGWLHVTDHCRAIQLVLAKAAAGAVYNVGGGDELSNVELTARLLELCDADPRLVERVADRMGHDLRYAVDDTRIRDELGYTPTVTFDAGLADTVAWYRDHTEWWRRMAPADRAHV